MCSAALPLPVSCAGEAGFAGKMRPAGEVGFAGEAGFAEEGQEERRG